MEWSRAFVVALKIMAVDVIFVVLILVLSLWNAIVAVIGSLILLIVIIAVAVFFILKEAEDMITVTVSNSANRMEELAKEEAKSTDNALNWIRSDLDEAKFQSMIDKLLVNNKKQGHLQPEIFLASQIKEKIAQGKTKEQAIEELYAKIKSRRRAKKELTTSEQKTNQDLSTTVKQAGT